MGPYHFILFQGLWCLADRKGRLEDRPDRIEAEIFPYKFQKVNVEKILEELSGYENPFIIRYTVNENRYIQIVKFEKHQRPHLREVESIIPARPRHDQGTTQAVPRHSLDALTPDSPFLTPDSLYSPNGETHKKPLTDIQKIVLTYKIASGYPKDDKAWDKLNFARCSKTAKALLEFFGNWKDAADCIQEIYEKFTSIGRTTTIETVQKHASEWKKNKQEKEAKFERSNH